MQIVIDIPEGMLDELRTCKFPIQDAYRLCVVIENGTPLPKGHGDLKDATTLKKMFEDKEGDDFTAFHFYDAIDDCPTIIEADEEVDE